MQGGSYLVWQVATPVRHIYKYYVKTILKGYSNKCHSGMSIISAQHLTWHYCM